MTTEKSKSWTYVQNLDLRKRIEEIFQTKGEYYARMEGMMEVIEGLMEATSVGEDKKNVLIEIEKAILRIEKVLLDLTVENLIYINALKEGLSAIESRLEKLETLDEMR